MRVSTVPLTDDILAWPAMEQAALRCSPLRHYRVFALDELVCIFRQQLASRLTTAGTIARQLLRGDGVAALGLCSPLPWDSDYFGMPMAQLECLAADDLPTNELAAFLETTLFAARRDHDIRLCTAAVDADDYALLNAFTASGFRVLDIKRSYVCKPAQCRPVRQGPFRPRKFQADDRAAVQALLEMTPFHSRFTRDEHLPAAATATMYRRWMDNLMALPEEAREIYVVEKQGRIIAAGGGRLADFSAANVSCRYLTDGIFASAAGATGAYIGITSAVVSASRDKDCRFVELKVSASNHAANRVLQFLGYREAGQQLALHRFLPDTDSPPSGRR